MFHFHYLGDNYICDLSEDGVLIVTPYNAGAQSAINLAEINVRDSGDYFPTNDDWVKEVSDLVGGDFKHIPVDGTAEADKIY